MRFFVAVAGIVTIGVVFLGIRWLMSGVSTSPIQFAALPAESGLGALPDMRADGRFRLIEAMGSGVGVIDFDQDGWMDLIVGLGGRLPGETGNREPAFRLYRNQTDGTFADVTASSGIDFQAFAQGVAVGDVDGDGLPDLVLTGFGEAALYRNVGGGQFEDITEASGIEVDGWPCSCALADLNGNGLLDLVVVRYLIQTIDDNGDATVVCPLHLPDGSTSVGYCPPTAHWPQSDLVFKNLGDGKFEDVSTQSKLSDFAGPGLGVLVHDFNGDQQLDWYVANDMQANQLWVNQGEHRFVESGNASGLAFGENGAPHAGMGIACGDYDGDGLDDVMVTNFQDQPNDFYRQLEPGQFSIVTGAIGLLEPSMPRLGFGTVMSDFDNDGWLDLFVTNGHLNELTFQGVPYRQPPSIFQNRGGRGFTEITFDCGPYARESWLGRAVAAADFNNDGRVDLAVSHLTTPPVVLINRSEEAGNSLTLDLRAATRSQSPIGSRVTVRAGERQIQRSVFGGSSYLASHDRRLHIGIGNASQPCDVEVQWPDGALQTFRGLQPNQQHRLEQSESPAPPASSS